MHFCLTNACKVFYTFHSKGQRKPKLGPIQLILQFACLAFSPGPTSEAPSPRQKGQESQ
jgi:hypothetical protein